MVLVLSLRRSRDIKEESGYGIKERQNIYCVSIAPGKPLTPRRGAKAITLFPARTAHKATDGVGRLPKTPPAKWRDEGGRHEDLTWIASWNQKGLALVGRPNEAQPFGSTALRRFRTLCLHVKPVTVEMPRD